MVYAEQRLGKIAEVTYELLQKGRELADTLKVPYRRPCWEKTSPRQPAA